MPVSVSYPGVYIEEIPSGVHTITGVATSICAFVGAAPRGPINVPTEIFSFGDFEQIFGGLTLAADGKPETLGFAVRDFFLNGGSDAIVVRVVGTAGAPSSVVLDTLTLSATSAGAWGHNLYAKVDVLDTRDPSNKALFNLTISEIVDNQTVKTERFINLSTNPTDPTFVDGYLKANSTLVVVSKVTGQIDPAKLPPATPSDPPKPTDGFTQFSESTDPAVAFGDAIGKLDAKTGIYALESVDIFNMLCLPPISPIADADSLKPLVTAAATYCQQRRAMYIMDPPDSWTKTWSDSPAKAIAAIFGDVGKLRDAASYTAVYFPRLSEPNPLHDYQLEEFAASGAIAGIFARTDVARGVWKAPAGLETVLSGVFKLTATINNDQNGKLNELGVNCLRTFPVAGNVVWGSRTLDGADVLGSDYKYVPVRRLTLFIEESLFRGTQWVVFEPNDEPLWSQIRLNVGAFMHDLYREGAFAGGTPQQAYFVACDDTTTTQTDINNGIVNIVVGFAPLKPAEFVVLKIQQMIGQIDV